jgi:hypothetical protein
MCFKYCVIGDTCYEYNKFKNDKKSSESKNDYEKRKSIRDELDIIEIGPKYAVNMVFNESKLIKDNLDYNIESKENPNVVLSIKNDKQLLNEYWKALSTAHECSIEVKNDKKKVYTVTYS